MLPRFRILWATRRRWTVSDRSAQEPHLSLLDFITARRLFWLLFLMVFAFFESFRCSLPLCTADGHPPAHLSSPKRFLALPQCLSSQSSCLTALSVRACLADCGLKWWASVMPVGPDLFRHKRPMANNSKFDLPPNIRGLKFGISPGFHLNCRIIFDPKMICIGHQSQ